MKTIKFTVNVAMPTAMVPTSVESRIKEALEKALASTLEKETAVFEVIPNTLDSIFVKARENIADKYIGLVKKEDSKSK